MAEKLTINKRKTAVLIMDYQNEIVQMLPQEQQVMLLKRAKQVLDGVRQAGLLVIYVVVRFREGYPEVSPHNKIFSNIKESARLKEATAGADIHAQLAPKQGEVIVTKRRVGAFSTTDLATVLKAKEIDTLVLLGITTSGVVLSTLRWAADMDFELTVLSDCCGDREEEVHRVLMQKVFPRQATVVTAEEFLSSLVAM